MNLAGHLVWKRYIYWRYRDQACRLNDTAV